MDIQGISLTASYEQREYTDDKAGAILRFIPVDTDGVRDPARTEFFKGRTFMQTNRGPVEIRFEIKADTLSQAFREWKNALQDELKDLENAQVKQRILNGAQLSPSEARALASKKQ